MPVRPAKNILWRALSTALLSVALLNSSVFAQQAATAPANALSTVESAASASVKVETIREVVTALSADEMLGRGTMQPGGDKAAQYLADRFAKIGLKPLGNKNSYLQPIKFKDLEFTPETSFSVGDESLKMRDDYVVTPPYSGDKSVSGNLVFVAYGLTSTSPKRNDLAGIDLKGKIVVMLDGPPKGVSKEQWRKAHAQISILQTLVRSGVAGLIFLSNGTEEHPYSEMSDYLSRRQVQLASEDEDLSFLPPFLSVSDAAAEKLFAASGLTLKQALEKAEGAGFEPFSLKRSAKITVRFKNGRGTSNNVVGLLEGTDPKLKAEAVVYSAHYDAYGIGAGNRIYHGAADNAIGVGEMIAIAEALSQPTARPRRSVIFMAVTGEEYGGYGADYWVHNPTWKIKQVAADLNFDGMGTEVYGPVKTLVGYGAEYSTLGATMNDVAAATGIKVIEDPMPDEKSFYRSDHYEFVKKGIPGLMLMGAPDGPVNVWVDRMKAWEKTDYHQPMDIIRPDWNWDGPRAIAAFGVVMGLRVGNSEQMPAWLPNSIFNRERGTNEPAPPEP